MDAYEQARAKRIAEAEAQKKASALTTPGVLEKLIDKQRIPFISKVFSDEEEQIMFQIPPEGVKFGDSTYWDDGSRYFVSPEGTPRGMAEFQFLPLKEGEEVRLRIEAYLKSMGSKETETA